MTGKNISKIKLICKYCDNVIVVEKIIKKCPSCKRNSLVMELAEKVKDTVELNDFIFNPDEIIQKRVFTSHLLEDKTFAFGILLPKTENVLDRQGNVVNKEQIWAPVIITSDRKGIPITKQIELEYKIRYEDIPGEMDLRWELRSIHDYIYAKETKVIDGLELFKRIRAQYEYYAYYREKNWYDVNALWDMGTYLHQLFFSFPIKEERGLSGTGKSKTMIISGFMTLNGTEIMVNPSESTLFRLTESKRATKYIDEAERLFKITIKGIESDNRVDLINASYMSNGVVPRQEKQGEKYITKNYHVYSPTRIGSINGLYGATENRAITQVHTKAPEKIPQGERQPEGSVHDSVWSEIRNDLYLWSLQNWAKIQDLYLNFTIDSKIKQRDLQLWKALIVIAQALDDKDLMPRMIQFAEKLSDQRNIEVLAAGSLDYQLLDALNKSIASGVENRTNRVYIERIRKALDEYWPVDPIINKPRKMSYNKIITNRLDKLGFGEFKGKDMIGAYYEITKSLFDEVVIPITHDFASQSALSSYLDDKVVKRHDAPMTEMMNDDNNNNNAFPSFSVMDPKALSSDMTQNDGKDAILDKQGENNGSDDKLLNGMKNELHKALLILMRTKPQFRGGIRDMADTLKVPEGALLSAFQALERQGLMFSPRSGVIKLTPLGAGEGLDPG